MGHGSAHVNDDEEDDSPVEEVSPAKPKKPSKSATRAKKNDPKEPPKEWTVEEEIALCQAWCDVLENNIVGNSMKTKGFWDAVIEYFEKESGSSRGYDSIVSKWKNRVRPRTGVFCSIINNVEDNHESGSNDIDVFQKACAEYKIIYSQDFTLENCYNILKDHQGWLEIEMPAFYNNAKGRKKSKTSETTSGSASGGFNLNNEADEAEEETQEVRPPGRDKSKAKKKSVASSRGKSSSIVDLLKNRELDIREAERREAAEFRREKIAIQRRTLELAEKEKRDIDILFYNTEINSSLPTIQQQKLQEMKDEIRERYNLDY
ncbi:retrotransposon protein, putative, ty3-gypsy subclass [Tanacetum coccineum]